MPRLLALAQQFSAPLKVEKRQQVIDFVRCRMPAHDIFRLLQVLRHSMRHFAPRFLIVVEEGQEKLSRVVYAGYVSVALAFVALTLGLRFRYHFPGFDRPALFQQLPNSLSMVTPSSCRLKFCQSPRFV